MIMDEVLAVGDMAFQKKCLDKMKDAANRDGRTVLYVSHNMNTIRQLCDRCVVLDKGQVVFQGNVEDAISIYMDRQMNDAFYRNYEEYKRPSFVVYHRIKLLEADYIGKDNVSFEGNEPMKLHFKWKNLTDVEKLGLRIEILNLEDTAIGTYIVYDFYSGQKDETVEMNVELDISMLMDAEYKTYYTFFNKSEQGGNTDLDCVPGLCFQKTMLTAEQKWIWRPKNWGYLQLPSPEINELKKF